MPNVVVALFFTAGASTWIYSKMYRRTGGNNKSSLTVAGACAVVIFLFAMAVLAAING